MFITTSTRLEAKFIPNHHSWTIVTCMVLTTVACIEVKFWINTTLAALKIANFNTTLVVLIPNFTATHVITSINDIIYRVHTYTFPKS